MRSILQLFIRYGGLMTFVMVELLCMYLIVSFNERQKGILAHTSMLLGGNVQDRWQGVVQYIGMKDRLDALNAKNAELQNQLINASYFRIPDQRTDSLRIVNIDTLLNDSVVRKVYLRPNYGFIPADVIGNSVSGNSNWLTINKGSDDGVRPDAGVVTTDGVVGIVRYVDRRYSMVMSVLHRQTKISAALKRQGYFGSLVWDGKNPAEMTLTDIPKHVNMQIGDTIVSSGYSLMFPKDLFVGVAVDSIPPENGSYFYSIKVRLGQDLAKVHEVRVINNLFKDEIERLQQKAVDEQR